MQLNMGMSSVSAPDSSWFAYYDAFNIPSLQQQHALNDIDEAAFDVGYRTVYSQLEDPFILIKSKFGRWLVLRMGEIGMHSYIIVYIRWKEENKNVMANISTDRQQKYEYIIYMLCINS